MFWILILGLLSPFAEAESSNRPLLQDILVSKNLKENQTTRLVCSIIQGEEVDFEWYFNDKKLDQNDRRRIASHGELSELVIKSLSIDDLGEYKCVGKNKYGQDVQTASLIFNGRQGNNKFEKIY